MKTGCFGCFWLVGKLVHLEQLAPEDRQLGAGAVSEHAEFGHIHGRVGKLVGWCCEQWLMRGSELFWVCR